jgi:hypothetical protein
MSLEREIKRRQLKQLTATRPHQQLQQAQEVERQTSELLLAFDIRERGKKLSHAIALARAAQR